MEQDVKKLEININQLIDSFDNLDTLLNKISIRSRRNWWGEHKGYSLSSTHIIYYHFVLKLNKYYYLAGNEKSRKTIINIGYNHLNNNYLKLEDKEKKYYLNNYYHQRIINEWEKSNL